MARRADLIFSKLQLSLLNKNEKEETLDDCSSANVNNSSVTDNLSNNYIYQPTPPIQETSSSDMPSNIESSSTLTEISEYEGLMINDKHCINTLDQNIGDISLDNLDSNPLLFIVGENGVLNPIELNFENNDMLPSKLPDELGIFAQNDFNATNVSESDAHENQIFQMVNDVIEVNNSEIHDDFIEENDILEPVNNIVDVGLQSEIEVVSIEESRNSAEVNEAQEGGLRQTNLNEEMSDEIVSREKRTRRKRHQVKENDWEYKKAKLFREKGEEYKGRRLVEGKSKFVVDKQRKNMKPITCKCKSPTFNCSVLKDDERKQQFSKFWSLTWPEKRIFVLGLTEIDLTARARDRKIEHESRRKFSYKFYLRINNKKLRVCRQTFLNTFDLKGWTVNNWLKEKTEIEDSQNADEPISMDEMEDENLCETSNKKKRSRPLRQEQLITKHISLKEFLLSLPTVESHYCRKSSTKLYLEPLWTSKSVIYEHYFKMWCKDKNVEPLSQCSFHKTFEDLNLAIFKPKKDQCDL